ncbi:hypothetical protein GmHk_U059404 [Glycine max]|nr:hypothetical protein GmHk_U059404 [Glycine max]
MRWKVGDGVRIRFWKDKWREGDLTLQDKYPALYQVSTQQNHSINSMGLLVDNRWEWKFQWRRNLFDHQIGTATAFMADIEDVHIQPSSRDLLLWSSDSGGSYTTKSTYNLLKAEDKHASEDNASKIIWSLKIPPRPTAFSWRIFKNKLPTKDNLRRRHVELPSYNFPLCDTEEETVGHVMRQVEVADRSCPFCGNMEEDAGHLFFHCSKILPLWWETLSWLNISAALPIDPKQHFLQHGSIMVGGTRINRWKCWWLVVTWTIWQKRNKIIFNNESLDSNKLIDDASFLLWTWLSNLEKGFAEHFNQWSTNIRHGFLY